MDFEAVYLSVHSFLRRSVRGVFAVHFFCAEPLRFLSLQHPNIHLSRFKSKHFWKFQTTQTKRTISLSLSLLLVSHEDQKKNASISLRLFLSLTLSAMLFDIHMVLHMRKCKTIPVRHMRSISTYVGICRPCTYVMSRTAQKCRPCARGLSQCTRNAMHSRSPSLSANPSDGRADKRRRRRRRRICDAEYVYARVYARYVNTPTPSDEISGKTHIRQVFSSRARHSISRASVNSFFFSSFFIQAGENKRNVTYRRKPRIRRAFSRIETDNWWYFSNSSRQNETFAPLSLSLSFARVRARERVIELTALGLCQSSSLA